MTLLKVNNPATKSFDGFFNDIFNELPANLAKNFKQDSFGFPPVNILEDTNNYLLEVSVPGYEKADFTIKLDGNILTLSAEKKEGVKSETEKVIRTEFKSKAFKRSFTLDEKVEASGIEAKYESGILKVNLPKKELARVTTKEITIQ